MITLAAPKTENHPDQHAQVNDNFQMVSMLKAQQMIARILPELLERSARDQFFRESLIEDSRITIEAVLSHRTDSQVKLPSHLAITVVEDTDSVTNLVAPAYNEAMKGHGAAPSPVCEVLINASHNPELLAELISDPTGVLQDKLSGQGYRPSDLSELPGLTVHTPEANEIVIVLPNRLIDRVAQSSAIEAELSLASWDPNKAMGPGTLVASYTSTAFTYCGNECSSNICSSNKSYCSC